MDRGVAQLFFASTGRIGRGRFLAAILVLLAAFALYERLATGAWHAATGWLVHLVLLFAALSVLAKRLHDRGRSGWWAAPALLAFDLVWPQPKGLVDGLAVAVLVVAAVDLGAMPGQPRENRFGPQPPPEG